MGRLDSQADRLTVDREGHSTPNPRVIEEEPSWRQRRTGPVQVEPSRRVVATRWRAHQRHTLEVRAESADDFHVVGLALRRINIRLAFNGRVVQDGEFMPGMLIINEPGLVAVGQLRGPTDVLHLHIPNAVIAECASHAGERGAAVLPRGASTAPDPAIERLGMALLGADELGSAFGHLYVDSISIAMVTRLLDTARRTSSAERRAATALAKWRLQRALDYIDGNLSRPVTLAELAAAAGLTRMHFAAQFRAATGLRPHEYLLRRRIERAQEMLRCPDHSIMDVAWQVGFQAQAHFTSTFRRFVGQPPHAWRVAQGTRPGASLAQARS